MAGAAQAAGGLQNSLRGLRRAKKTSSMLVQAQAGEAQAARGFWEGPGKKKSKIAVASWAGAAQAAGGM